MAELMDLRELAAYLRLDRQTLYNWLHQRKLSGIKMGGVWRFNRQMIDRWLQEQTVQASPRRRSYARNRTASLKRATQTVRTTAHQTTGGHHAPSSTVTGGPAS